MPKTKEKSNKLATAAKASDPSPLANTAWSKGPPEAVAVAGSSSYVHSHNTSAPTKYNPLGTHSRRSSTIGFNGSQRISKPAVRIGHGMSRPMSPSSGSIVFGSLDTALPMNTDASPPMNTVPVVPTDKVTTPLTSASSSKPKKVLNIHALFQGGGGIPATSTTSATASSGLTPTQGHPTAPLTPTNYTSSPHTPNRSPQTPRRTLVDYQSDSEGSDSSQTPLAHSQLAQGPQHTKGLQQSPQQYHHPQSFYPSVNHMAIPPHVASSSPPAASILTTPSWVPPASRDTPYTRDDSHTTHSSSGSVSATKQPDNQAVISVPEERPAHLSDKNILRPSSPVATSPAIVSGSVLFGQPPSVEKWDSPPIAVDGPQERNTFLEPMKPDESKQDKERHRREDEAEDCNDGAPRANEEHEYTYGEQAEPETMTMAQKEVEIMGEGADTRRTESEASSHLLATQQSSQDIVDRASKIITSIEQMHSQMGHLTLNQEEPERENRMPSELVITKGQEQSMEEDIKICMGKRDVDKALAQLKVLPDRHHPIFVEKCIAIAFDNGTRSFTFFERLFAAAHTQRICASKIFDLGFRPAIKLADETSLDQPRTYEWLARLMYAAGLTKARVERMGEMIVVREELIMQPKYLLAYEYEKMLS
ncbi:eukaryotic translation initiation factor 4 gamma [Ceratobasidium sp. AG-Ba]|nr:eukaryotic translation initiation factor 4 gamma [Ceratobasidium sp. AG-Ba]